MGTMTPLFVTRLFEERAAAGAGHAGEAEGTRRGRQQGGQGRRPGGMGWEAFLDFLLAWEHRGSRAGVRYFFPLFDLRARGYLTQARCMLSRQTTHQRTRSLLRSSSCLLCRAVLVIRYSVVQPQLSAADRMSHTCRLAFHMDQHQAHENRDVLAAGRGVHVLSGGARAVGGRWAVFGAVS